MRSPPAAAGRRTRTRPARRHPDRRLVFDFHGQSEIHQQRQRHDHQPGFLDGPRLRLHAASGAQLRRRRHPPQHHHRPQHPRHQPRSLPRRAARQHLGRRAGLLRPDLHPPLRRRGQGSALPGPRPVAHHPDPHRRRRLRAARHPPAARADRDRRGEPHHRRRQRPRRRRPAARAAESPGRGLGPADHSDRHDRLHADEHQRRRVGGQAPTNFAPR